MKNILKKFSIVLFIIAIVAVLIYIYLLNNDDIVLIGNTYKSEISLYFGNNKPKDYASVVLTHVLNNNINKDNQIIYLCFENLDNNNESVYITTFEEYYNLFSRKE